MNYYPNNFYQNYSYGNQQYQPQQQIPALQGKVVDSVDVVRASEIPFGGFGIFPKGDFSEIYIKSWNNNGTTQINTYKPIPIEETVEVKTANAQNELLEKLSMLNQKLDSIMGQMSPIDKQQSPVVKAEVVPKKEVNINAY